MKRALTINLVPPSTEREMRRRGVGARGRPAAGAVARFRVAADERRRRALRRVDPCVKNESFLACARDALAMAPPPKAF